MIVFLKSFTILFFMFCPDTIVSITDLDVVTKAKSKDSMEANKDTDTSLESEVLVLIFFICFFFLKLI